MSNHTKSESLFELLCKNRGFECERIPEAITKTADYRVIVDGGVTIVAEVKQLDPNENDVSIRQRWGDPSAVGTVAPSNRVRGLLSDGYPQVKQSVGKTLPGMIVLYNNSGPWNWIDSFTVSRAMFGSYGVVVGLGFNGVIVETGRGYLGNRKVTKGTFRSLSAVGVLKETSGGLQFQCYHNPFAHVPIEPSSIAALADEQYLHGGPHDRGFVPWEPSQIEM